MLPRDSFKLLALLIINVHLGKSVHLLLRHIEISVHHAERLKYLFFQIFAVTHTRQHFYQRTRNVRAYAVHPLFARLIRQRAFRGAANKLQRAYSLARVRFARYLAVNFVHLPARRIALVGVAKSRSHIKRLANRYLALGGHFPAVGHKHRRVSKFGYVVAQLVLKLEKTPIVKYHDSRRSYRLCHGIYPVNSVVAHRYSALAVGKTAVVAVDLLAVFEYGYRSAYYLAFFHLSVKYISNFFKHI